MLLLQLRHMRHGTATVLNLIKIRSSSPVIFLCFSTNFLALSNWQLGLVRNWQERSAKLLNKCVSVGWPTVDIWNPDVWFRFRKFKTDYVSSLILNVDYKIFIIILRLQKHYKICNFLKSELTFWLSWTTLEPLEPHFRSRFDPKFEILVHLS